MSKPKKPRKSATRKAEPPRPVLKLEPVLDMILAGLSYRNIAENYKVSYGTLTRFLALPDHSTRVREALEQSAQDWDDEATRILMSAIGAPMNVVVAANNVAHHLRWKASKRNPKQFGDKVEVDHGITEDFASRLDEAKKRYREALEKPPL